MMFVIYWNINFSILFITNFAKYLNIVILVKIIRHGANSQTSPLSDVSTSGISHHKGSRSRSGGAPGQSEGERGGGRAEE